MKGNFIDVMLLVVALVLIILFQTWKSSVIAGIGDYLGSCILLVKGMGSLNDERKYKVYYMGEEILRWVWEWLETKKDDEKSF